MRSIGLKRWKKLSWKTEISIQISIGKVLDPKKEFWGFFHLHGGKRSMDFQICLTFVDVHGISMEQAHQKMSSFCWISKIQFFVYKTVVPKFLVLLKKAFVMTHLFPSDRVVCMVNPLISWNCRQKLWSTLLEKMIISMLLRSVKTLSGLPHAWTL